MFDPGNIEFAIAIFVLLWALYYVGKNVYRQMTIGENADTCETCELHKHVSGHKQGKKKPANS